MKFFRTKTNRLAIASFLLMIGFFILYFNHSANAQVALLNFAGKVTNSDGSEVADGVYDFSFGIYSEPTGGAPLWTETFNATTSFSGTIATVTVNADSITYQYNAGANATTTLRVGQYLFNSNTSESALIISYNNDSVTVANGSPTWTAGQAINNRPFVEGGVIDVNLGAVSDISGVNFGGTRYLQITFNGEVMQPRKILTTDAAAFTTSQLGGKTESQFATLAENETITGEWNFNNIININASTTNTILTVTQSGSGDIAEFKRGTSTAFALLDDGRIQIGNYYLPSNSSGASAGYVLKINSSGNMYWANDLAGSGGGVGLWATSTLDNQVIQSDTGQIVVLGDNHSSISGYQFEVNGSSLFDQVDISSAQALRFNATNNTNYVGIRASGTVASTYTLVLPDRPGSTGQSLILGDNNYLYWGSPSSFTYVNSGIQGQLPYYAANGSALSATSSLYLSTNGYLGVGTTTPTRRLSVIGYGQFSQGVCIGSTCINNWTSAGSLDATSTISDGQIAIWYDGNTLMATNTLSVAHGGTGVTSFTTNGILYGNGGGYIHVTPQGSSGFILQANSSGVPTWVSTSSLGIDFNAIGGILAISQGGTGANSTSTARTNLGLSTIYSNRNYMINGAGNNGEVWVSNGGTGVGGWRATGSLGLLSLNTIGGLSTNYISKWNGSKFVNSILYDDGTHMMIGTTTSQNALTVMSGSGSAQLRLAYDADNYAEFKVDDQGQLSITQSNSATTTIGFGDEALRILPNGYIGIGTTSPKTLLSVNGTSSALTYCIGDNCITDWSQSGAVAINGTPNIGDIAIWTNNHTIGASTTLSVVNGGFGLSTVGFNGLAFKLSGENWTSTSTLSFAYGGTGLNTISQGSLLYATSSNKLVGLAPGPNGSVLQSNGSGLIWADSVEGAAHPLLSASHSGTEATTTARGDIIIRNATVWTRLGLGGTGFFLRSNGTDVTWSTTTAITALGTINTGTWQASPIGSAYGGFGANTSIWNDGIAVLNSGTWSSSSTLSVIRGGTGLSSILAGQTLYASSNNKLSATSSLYIAANGNIGIGSTSPSQKLSVNGNGAFSGLCLGDECIASWTESGAVSISGTPNAGEIAIWTDNNTIGASSTLSTTRGGFGVNTSGFNGLAFKSSGGNWTSTTTLSLLYGGTGATTALGARYNLGLRDVYDFGITSTGTAGQIWMADGDGRGAWTSTSSFVFDSDFINNGLMFRSGLGSYTTTSTISVAYGGTGATTALGARYNLGLRDVYDFGITSTGTAGQIWMADGDGRGAWTSTSSFVFDSDFSSNGIMVRTANGSYNTRFATGTTDEILVTNGDGAAGDITISLPDAVYLGANGRIGRNSSNYISFETDNELAFFTNGSSRMILDTSGNLMLGTSTAGAKLTILSGSGPQLRLAYDANNYYEFNVSPTGGLDINPSSATSSLLTIGTAEAYDNGIIFDGAPNDYYIAGDASDNSLKFGIGKVIGASSTLTILTNGYIGVGTTTPSSQFSIGSGQISAHRGSASAPTYTVMGDLNTGMYSSGSDTLNFSAGGISRLQIDGTSIYASTTLKLINGSVISPSLVFNGDTDSGLYWINADTFGLSAGGSNKLTINSTGIGIGTTTPTQLFAIGATSTQQFLVNNIGQVVDGTWNGDAIGVAYGGTGLTGIGQGQILYGSAANTLAATSALYMASNGNIGVGTTTPQEKFVMNGGNFLHTASGNPTLEGAYPASGYTYGVYVSGKYAYVADGGSGLQIIDISNPASPTLSGTYNTSGSAVGIYVSGKYAYVADGGSGLQIIDISNPASPTLSGTYNTSGSAWDVYVSGKYAYVVSELSTLQIIDISNPASPTLTGTYVGGGAANSVYVSGKYAYVANSAAGLLIIDISNPASPTLSGTYNTSGFAYDVYVSGKYAYVADDDSGLQIIDTSNPASPTLTGTYDTGGAAEGVYVSGKYAYVADASSGLQIIDTSNPDSPTLSGTYNTSFYAESVYVSGKYAYVADGNSGLQIIDINGIETPSMYAGNIQTNNITVTENADIGNNLLVRGGFNVGSGGILSNGSVTISPEATTTTALTIVQGGTGNLLDLYKSTNKIFTIKSNGYVGIGTGTPSNLLSVGATTSQQFIVNRAGTVIDGTWNGDAIGVAYGGTGLTGIGQGQILYGSATNTLAATSSLYMASNGNVGIGTTNPGVYQLNVAGNTMVSGGNIYLDNNYALTNTSSNAYLLLSNGYTDLNASSNLRFTTGGTERVRIDSSGRLGLGTTSPAYKFDIYDNNTNSYLANIYNASSTAASGGGLSIRVDGDGALLNLNHNGTDIVTITGAQTTFNNPVTFGSVGDVSMAYDLYLTNAGAGHMYFNGPGYIQTDSSWQNLDLTLTAANLGDVVIDDTANITGTTTIADTLYVNYKNSRVGIGSSTPAAKLALVDATAGNASNVFMISTSTAGGAIFRVTGNGNVYGDGATYNTGADYAEYFKSKDTDLIAGEAVCVSVDSSNTVERCKRGADGNIMGIVSTKPSIVGNAQDNYINNKNYSIVAMLGQIPAKVSAENGAIRPGDQLTSASSTAGYIMKANPGDSTVGVALEGLDSGKGTIKVLISRRNKSLTVEMVEAKITENIAAMEIEDEVKIMLAEAVKNYNFDQKVNDIVNEQMSTFDSILTAQYDETSNKLSIIAASVDNVIARLNAVESRMYNLDNRLNMIEAYGQTSLAKLSSSTIEVTAEGNVKINAITINNEDSSSTSSGIAIVDITTLASTSKTAFVVNQQGDASVADFQADGISVVNIAETGKVTIVGEMLVDGRIMICSGGACGSALDNAVDETAGDMGVEGKVVAGAFESYCEDGFVWVPGSAKYGTLPGFCISQDKEKVEGTEDYRTNISQGDAALSCQTKGEGYHLISENEWMTIAENAIRVGGNDVNELPGLQLATSTKDEATSTLFALSNTNKIYNMVGPISEWTDQTVTKAGLIEPLSADWQEYYEMDNYKGLNIIPPYYYTSQNGIGKVKTGEGENILSGFVRGGTGLYSLDLSNSPTVATTTIGFRCAK